MIFHFHMCRFWFLSIYTDLDLWEFIYISVSIFWFEIISICMDFDLRFHFYMLGLCLLFSLVLDVVFNWTDSDLWYFIYICVNFDLRFHFRMHRFLFEISFSYALILIIVDVSFVSLILDLMFDWNDLDLWYFNLRWFWFEI